MTLATLLAAGGVAAAQTAPSDPYAPPAPVSPATPPAPPAPPAPEQTPQPATQDPALAEQVAASLVARAEDLHDARELADAKQLAVEAVVASPHGPAAEKARALIHLINQQLGIPEEPTQRPPVPVAPPPKYVSKPLHDRHDEEDETHESDSVPAAEHNRKLAAQVHVGLYTGIIGGMLGTAVGGDDNQGTGGVVLGTIGAVAGAVYLAPVVANHFDEAQIRTMGAGSVWGGVIGAFTADITTGVGRGESGTTGRQVMIGAGIGATVGALGGYGLARSHKLTRGDAALVDTLASAGTLAGFGVGLLMQPVQSEAYDVNAVLGAVAGVAIGLYEAPRTNTTTRRMMRVLQYTAVGGIAPYVLFAATGTSSGGERAIGALSTIGIGAGMFLGFHATQHWDEGLDVQGTDDGAKQKADAPPAVVGRASDGSWQLGAPGVLALSPQLDNHQHGMGLTLVGATF